MKIHYNDTMSRGQIRVQEEWDEKMRLRGFEPGRPIPPCPEYIRDEGVGGGFIFLIGIIVMIIVFWRM